MQRKVGIEDGLVFPVPEHESGRAVLESTMMRSEELRVMASDQIVSTGIRPAPLVSPLLIARYWWPVCLYAGLIFLGSSVSNPPEAISSVLEKISDKMLHLCEYGLLGALGYRACRHAAGAWVARHAVIVTVAGCALYGLSDEMHQLFVPFREGDPLDLVADSVGAMLGAWTWRFIERRNVPSSQ